MAQTPNPKPSSQAAAWEIRAARRIAQVMDSYHVDPIVGFVLPGLGDVLGGLVGIGLVGLGYRHGVHKLTLARMCLNVALDTALGAIPIVGDIFDWLFVPNTKNARLLERATTRPHHPLFDGLILGLAASLCLMALLAPLGLFVWLLSEAFAHAG